MGEENVSVHVLKVVLCCGILFSETMYFCGRCQHFGGICCLRPQGHCSPEDLGTLL
jgi:hypothetical protein